MALNKMGTMSKVGPVAILEQTLTQEKLEGENNILNKLGVNGGPTNVREWLVECHDDID